MNYYRSLVGSGSGNLKAASYTAMVNHVYQLGSCDKAFSNNTIFNDEVTIGDRVFSCNFMFLSCTNFNQNVNIPDNVKYCRGMFSGCTNFNQNVIIPENVSDCVHMFNGCTNFTNKNIILPANVGNCIGMFIHIPNLSINLYVNGTNKLNFIFSYYSNGAMARKNIFCSDFNIAYNVLGWDIGWTNATNCKYNTYYNIYIYNNYSV